jgi:hypothetical protein
MIMAKKIKITVITLILLTGNLLAAPAWDILDKPMAAWNANGGSSISRAWTTSQKGSGIAVTQKDGYVNITKTGVAASNNYAFLIPPALTLSTGTAYSFTVRARVHAIPDAGETEAHQISARFNERNMAIYLRHGDENSGYISLTAEAVEEDRCPVNTSEWHVYRFVFHADNLGYDVYMDEIEAPVFENVPAAPMTGSNIIRLGAESTQRCNMDIEEVKMGTGDFYSKTKIVSVALSSDSHLEGIATTVTATVHTVLVNDSEKLRVSLVDSNDNTVIDATDAVVSQNRAEISLDIPATIPKGEYFVKAAAPDGKIGDVDVSPRKSACTIYTSRFAGKNLATFGNSITIAANSWAYQTHQKLGFGDLYNGAMSASVWCKREKTFDDGVTIWTQNFYDPGFSGITTLHDDNMTKEEYQKRINNCAIVHVQKYLKQKTKIPDYVIFSYGTNDPLAIAGDAESVDVFTMAGALKWCVDTLRTEFPGVKIYVALPLQASKARNKNDDTRAKVEILKQVCDGLSTPYFDCFSESGITEENQAKYLGDGLHPNEAGKVLHAKYIMKKLDEAASSPSFMAREEVRRESISVSAGVLSAGQAVSVKSLAEDASLAETALYGIAGNTVYRKSLSGNECTFYAPVVAGWYVLTAKLENGLSKEFKILVK